MSEFSSKLTERKCRTRQWIPYRSHCRDLRDTGAPGRRARHASTLDLKVTVFMSFPFVGWGIRHLRRPSLTCLHASAIS